MPIRCWRSAAVTASIPVSSLPPGAVVRAGRWALVNRAGTVTAVSPHCRRRLADLSKGTLAKAYGALLTLRRRAVAVVGDRLVVGGRVSADVPPHG